MPDFGQCSEPSCSGLSVRLFDCVHHCMKSVCLQHLIEHDRSVDHNGFRTELQQLWTTYSLLVNETKLQCEFEQKLKKHQQLIRDLTNLFQYDSVNIEQHRLMLEKLKQYIEQEKQHSLESLPKVEQIKTEPFDEISTTDESDSLDVSLATRIEKLNNDIGQQKRKSMANNSITIDEYDHQMYNTSQTSNNQMHNYQSIRESSGQCPFWFDGAFGLTKKFHGIHLCPPKKSYRQLYRHLIRFHKLTVSSGKLIYEAILSNEDSRIKKLFQSHDIVIDQVNQFRCPFSIYNKTSSIIRNSSQHHCRSVKLQLGYTLRAHLLRVHHMKISNANRLIWKLQTNSKEIKC